LNDFWYWKDREIAEIGVARKVLFTVGETFEGLRSRPVGDDPPDCEATIGGIPCGIEVTEFMHEPTHRTTMRGKPQFFMWDKGDFLTELGRRICRKDKAKLKGGPYGRYILIFVTDEFSLTHDLIKTFLDGARFETRLVTDIFFALSYDPALQLYPVFKVPVRSV
jgi:hypothetical protein